MHSQMKELRQMRQAWTCEKSDCIGFAKLMVDYFNYGNKDGSDFDSQMGKMEQFCKENDLNSKSMKEAHYLCIQL